MSLDTCRFETKTENSFNSVVRFTDSFIDGSGVTNTEQTGAGWVDLFYTETHFVIQYKTRNIIISVPTELVYPAKFRFIV